MKKVRAIYTGDIKHNQCPVFELSRETGWFEMLEDKSFRYEKECVYEDPTFLVFEVENYDVKMVINLK